MSQHQIPPTEKLFFCTVFGTKEAELYSDLLQGILDNSNAVTGEVHVEQIEAWVGTEIFDIYIKFFPLKEEYQNIELCKTHMKLCLQCNHINLLKQQLGM